MSLLSIKMQKLMISGLENGGIQKGNQKIYSSRKFYEAMNFLEKNGYFMTVCMICRKRIYNERKNICDKDDEAHIMFKKNRQMRDNKKLFLLTLKGEIQAMSLKGLHD